MIKVLIIDDEEVIRTGIKLSIDWESMGMEIVGEASNGKDGLRLALELNPQIVLADIKMPLMDGLEFTKYLKEKDPAARIIIISGYDEFTYAKKAIQLGVNEYLLKPIGAGELIQIMLKQRDEIIGELNASTKERQMKEIYNSNLPYMQSRLMNALIKGDKTDISALLAEADILGIELPGPEFQLLIFDIDDFFLIVDGMSDIEKEALKHSIKKTCEDELNSYAKNVIWFSEFDYLIAIMSINDENKQLLGCIYKKMQDAVQTKHQYSLTVGSSNIFTSIGNCPQAFAEATAALRSKIFKGKGKVIHISEVDKSLINAQTFYPSDNEKEILAGLRSMDLQLIFQILDKMMNSIRVIEADREVIENIVLRLIIVSISQLEALGVSIKQKQNYLDPRGNIKKYETLDDIVAWLKTAYTDFIQIMENTKSDQYKYIVKLAIQYMEEHYSEDIKIKKLAAITCVTPNYFSRVFNQETGKSFAQWLNNIRLEKAKNLLDECGLKIYEIAEKVGYHNYKSF